MNQLATTNFPHLRPLFQGAYLTLMVDSLIAGSSTGLAWVDDLIQPQSALVWDNGYSFYLVGRADNQGFNQQLGQLFLETLVPAARDRGIDGFKVLYSSPAWVSQLATIFPTLSLAQYPRVVYSLGASPLPDWRSKLPTGFAMRPINQAMLTDSTLGNLPDLIEEIAMCWPSQARFLADGFGFCLVGNGEIICRCTAEYTSPGKCGIGIATAEAYRRQGFAALTASAFIEHCIARQIVPYWDAWQRNTASVATAETIGLHKIQAYDVHVGPLPAA